MKHVVVVAAGRSAVAKGFRGALCHTRPEDIAIQVMRGVLGQVPELDPKDIDDVIVGCAFPEAEQGFNVAKGIAMGAGLVLTPAQTVNRFCSSGLQSIVIGANAIMAGQQKVVVAGGVESMTYVPMEGNAKSPYPGIGKENFMSMGLTAENVAKKYNVTRQEQDAFAVESHQKAAAAQAAGRFDREIIPVEAVVYSSNQSGRKPFDKDDGIRADSTLETLGKFPCPFKKDGTVTAGNASQISDGAAFTVLMEAGYAKSLGLTPLARFVGYAVAGVPPELMGIGPVEAIPKILKLAALSLKDIDLIELNEAFASQALACINTLQMDRNRINVNGGAIALGHPLGCTGAMLATKLLYELRRSGGKRGLVSMCIGGGMGAAGVFEAVC